MLPKVFPREVTPFNILEEAKVESIEKENEEKRTKFVQGGIK